MAPACRAIEDLAPKTWPCHPDGPLQNGGGLSGLATPRRPPGAVRPGVRVIDWWDWAERSAGAPHLVTSPFRGRIA